MAQEPIVGQKIIFFQQLQTKLGLSRPMGQTVNGGASDPFLTLNVQILHLMFPMQNLLMRSISVLDGESGSIMCWWNWCELDRASMGLLGTGLTTGRLLQNDGETNATDCTNSAKLLWVIELTNPVTITPTSQITMFFKTTDSVSIDLIMA